MSSSRHWRTSLRAASAVIPLFVWSLAANAVILRGHVRDPLNRPIVAAPVQLVQNGQVIAATKSMPDGSYELRGAGTGRFTVVAAGPGFGVYRSESFYGGTFDLLSREITLHVASATEETSVTATGLPTPVQQVSAAVDILNADEMLTRAYVLPEFRMQPGVDVVQTGQYGGATSLFVRGANSDANKVLVDGVPANDVGGIFNFGLLTTTGIASVELHRGPDSVLYGTNALGSVVSITSPKGSTLRPALNYSGDAGNFHTWRNEVSLDGAFRKLDYYTAFSRFDSSNALPLDRMHLATSAANIGYALNGSTSLRGTVRNMVSAQGLPGPWDFYGIAAAAKEADQNTFFTGVLDNTYHANWHNLVRYYGSRKRQQTNTFHAVGEAITFQSSYGPYTSYYGNTVTIRGANGYSGTGRAAFTFADPFPQPTYAANNNDGVQYQTDYRFTSHLSVLGGFRYEDERGSYINAAYYENQKAERRNYEYNLQFQGDIKGRVFYTLGGAIQKNYLFGTKGTPRLGIAGYPVLPGRGWMHGTKLHFNFSKGVQEPNLSSQLQSVYALLQENGMTSTIQQAHIHPIGAEEARTYEGGIDQNIYNDRLMLHFNYFHNQFGNQVEYVYSSDIKQYFDIDLSSTGSYGAYLNSLDFKAQGVEAALEWNAGHGWMLRGGYTYTDAIVERSFASDVTALLSGYPNENPNIPGVAIGSSSPLVGQRPFRRPPQMGYASAEYTHRAWSAGVKAAFVSRSDDSTFLSYMDINGGNTLLLPNRNLDYAYQRVDAHALVQVQRHLTVFTELNNLLGEQHMGPIGYPALPFNFRAGLKIRLGGM